MQKLVYLLIVFTLKTESLLLTSNLNVCDYEKFINDTVNKIKLYQVILTSKIEMNKNYREIEYFAKFEFSNIPMIRIDFNNLDVLRNIMDYAELGSPRYSSLFVSLYESDIPDFTELSNLLDNYTNIFRRSIRPLWLIILLFEEPLDNQSIEAFLFDAWQKKFLDLVVIEAVHGKIHSYNHFRDGHSIQFCHDQNINLFPDKIKDLNGYNLTTYFYDDPPSVHVQRNYSTGEFEASGLDYWLIETISNALNFSFKLMDDILVTDIYSDVQQGKMDFSGNKLYFWNEYLLERSMMMNPDGYCVMVPILPAPDIESNRFYFGLIFTILHILFLMYVTKLLKFDEYIWTWPNIFQVILGLPIPRQPIKLAERMIIGSLIILSLSYSSVFYAKLTDNNLEITRVLPFNSFHDLDKSGLVPMIQEYLYNRTFDVYHDESQTLKRLKEKSRFWDDPISCVEELLKNKTIACVLTESLGESLIEQFRYPDGLTMIKIMKPCFWITWKGFAFEPGSPYTAKFDKTMMTIFESGLVNIWEKGESRKKNRDGSVNPDASRILNRMILILAAGYLVSILAFLVEAAVYYINSHL